MKITRFVAKDLHGYLNFDIKFNNRLTFLTGINGTGKTTALNSIVSLLIPDIQFLCNVQFDFIKVTVKINSKKFTISAKSNEIGAELRIGKASNLIQLNSYLRDPDIPPSRQEEYEAEYYREQISDLRGNEVIKQIMDLPSPMYLGLDRRVVHGRGRRLRRSLETRTRRIEAKQTVFSGNMENRLADALELARHSYSQQTVKQNVLDAEFQRQLLLELINLSPVSIGGDLVFPGQEEAAQVGEWVQTLATLPDILKLPVQDVNFAIKPMSDFLIELRESISQLPKVKTEEDISNNPTIHHVMLKWAFNRPYIEKIERVSEIISDYERKKYLNEEPNQRYLKGINRFFRDGGKIVEFDEVGRVIFSSTKTEKKLGFNSLSSGEIQLFVILTHLYFNPDAQDANLFIIDEPELSLHVNWQESFVDSLLEATDDVQLILATHAPSIILHRIEECIEIEQK